MPSMFESGVFSGGESAWHGLGVVLEQDTLTSEEALRHSGLGGWELEKLPLFTRVGQSIVPVPDRFAHVRKSDKRVLGVVGNVYTTVTNERAFEWADELVGGFGAHFKTAGSLYGGRVVWMYLEVPFKIEVPGDSALRTGLYLTNSHDGSSHVECAFTTVRIVCANTLAMAKATGVDRVRIKHTVSAPSKLAEAQRVMHLADGARERSAKLAETLFAKSIDASQVAHVLDEVFPLPDVKGIDYDSLSRGDKKALTGAQNKRDAVLAAYNSANLGAPAVRGTAWGLYNAFSAAYQHQEIDGKDDEQNQRKAQSIFSNIMDGVAPADKALAILSR